ncbi:hypothetical protein MVEN_02206400 [Mycena venus]|uniref:Uncharacterized protein n=1 Tax=Mycena venus TaxID=2733690 RepID=A0A8H6X7I5_9AGAR|nr:hypothetical protein MVEN_02206400 [Mycena venus]
MATIVERPLSAFSDSMSSSTVVPHRRRRDSVEIIDVDSFEELPNPNPRPAQRRRVEQDPVVIELLDSDDEPEPAAGSSGGSEGPRRGFRLSTAPDVRANSSNALAGPSSSRARRLRELFSPPPPIPDDSIPPVPPLPRRYSAFGSFPRNASPTRACSRPAFLQLQPRGVRGFLVVIRKQRRSSSRTRPLSSPHPAPSRSRSIRPHRLNLYKDLLHPEPDPAASHLA